MTSTTEQSPTEQPPSERPPAHPRGGKLRQAERAFVELLDEATRRGFYGSATLTIQVQDGHVQHVRVASERLLK